ncbi:MAG: methionine ABC transporter ATP-binding protein, partial [Azoarcus sp.]|nr:methionine ABC transporter ATP-binding protein [Azoarcus sp.]
GIARALATGPRILLCDEATSALDPQTTQSVLRLLDEINRELKLTIVLITHEMNVIRTLCDRVAVLDEGRVVEAGEVAEVFLQPRHAVSRRFVSESESESEFESNSESEDTGGTYSRGTYDHAEGRLLRLSFRGEKLHDAVFGRIMREYGVDFRFVSGHIGRIKNMPYGRLVLNLTGARTNEALERIRIEGITAEDLR